MAKQRRQNSSRPEMVFLIHHRIESLPWWLRHNRMDPEQATGVQDLNPGPFSLTACYRCRVDHLETAEQ